MVSLLLLRLAFAKLLREIVSPQLLEINCESTLIRYVVDVLYWDIVRSPCFIDSLLIKDWLFLFSWAFLQPDTLIVLGVSLYYIFDN